MPTCTHVDQIKQVTPGSNGCEECLASGDYWVHLRMCLSCGHVGCCDSSKNRHASKHYLATDHPVAAAAEAGEDWAWCYPDQLVLQPERGERRL